MRIDECRSQRRDHRRYPSNVAFERRNPAAPRAELPLPESTPVAAVDAPFLPRSRCRSYTERRPCPIDGGSAEAGFTVRRTACPAEAPVGGLDIVRASGECRVGRGSGQRARLCEAMRRAVVKALRIEPTPSTARSGVATKTHRHLSAIPILVASAPRYASHGQSEPFALN